MRRSHVFFGSFFVLCFGAAVLYLASLANGPDLDLSFTRAVPSKSSAANLDIVISTLANWPQWFFSLDAARAVDDHGKPLPARDQVVAPGRFILLYINPKKGKWTHFTILTRVKSYDPRKLLDLEVVSDSSNRLTRLFDHLDWKIELLPSGQETRIAGTASARTRSWRSRLFGHIADRVMMNQVFYPDLIRLGELSLPLAPTAPPALEVD